MGVAGIDQGTTSTRVLVVNAGGEPQVVHSVEHKQIYPQEGWVEQDPEELISNIQACANAVGKVDAIGIDNQGESCLAWDAITKEALSPVIVWQDNRTIGEIEMLKADGKESETFARAGLPLDPYFSASKMAWIVKNIPAAKTALAMGTLRLGTTDAFFLDRLTGRFVTDVSTASRTSLLNIHEMAWDENLCKIFGVPVECLPRIVPTTGDFGVIETAHGPTPVTASVVDQQAALYGFGCRVRGDAKITFGTGAFALMVTGDEIVQAPEQGLLPTIAWQLDGEGPVFALEGGVYTASSAINWARSLGLFRDLSEIDAIVGPPAIESGLVFVPALAGLGCPHWDARARGSWMGLSLDHKPEQLVQSILEGVALRATEVIDAMDRCVPIESPLFIDGGMSKNPYFVRFLSDVTFREVRPAHMPELTGLGTAKLASKMLGHELEVLSHFGTVQPAMDAHHLMDQFRQAVSFVRNWRNM